PPKKFFMETSLEEWKKSFQSLLMNAVETILEAIPPMKEQKYGRIIFSTSTAAKEPSPSLTLSSTFRGGLLTLMKSLSQELAPYQITVNALLPGFIKTTMLVERFNNLEDIAATIPSKRLGLPEEIASLALFLGSKQASYITGQAIACDGGLLKGL
ncbi:MAG: SDR family oxidoreductase, partial [Chlamydiae bacterium]|nr:SDR family oxidoreductase [Chlamydiota bacterium]